MKVAVCGHGECGKDLVCEILRDFCGLRYTHSTSVEAAKVVFDVWGNEHYPDSQSCWNDRRNHREMWKRIIMDYNAVDPTRMYIGMLSDQDILNGIRDDREQAACYKAGIVDLWIWVDRDVPVDPTIKYGPEECDVIIPNNGSKGRLVDRVIALFGLNKPANPGCL